jgi:transcriptional regulator with XRE-family HTH domain
MRSTHSISPVADNVRAAMAYRRVDQAAIGALLHKSQSSISDRLTSKTEFRVSELQAIAVHLDVPLEQLLAPAKQAES